MFKPPAYEEKGEENACASLYVMTSNSLIFLHLKLLSKKLTVSCCERIRCTRLIYNACFFVAILAGNSESRCDLQLFQECRLKRLRSNIVEYFHKAQIR